MVMRLRRELLGQMVWRLSMVVMSMTVRVLILHRYGENVWEVTLRDLFLEVLLDGVVQFMECQLVAAMIWVQKLLALLSRQIRRLRVASAIKKWNQSACMSLTLEFMLLKVINLN